MILKLKFFIITLLIYLQSLVETGGISVGFKEAFRLSKFTIVMQIRMNTNLREICINCNQSHILDLWL